MNKKFVVLFLIFVLFSFSVFCADTLKSAKEILQESSNRFKSEIKDFEADIKCTQDNSSQKGVLIFKNPQKLRINLFEPSKQVICTNGYMLWVYIDYLNLVLKQEILKKSKLKTDDGKVHNLVNPVLLNIIGYDKFLSDYAIEYDETKELVGYKDGTKVYKLKLLRWKSSKSGFGTVYISIQQDGLMRRVEGITSAYRHVILEIDNIKVNKNIGDMIFDYDPPVHTNTIDNFITNQGDGLN